MIQIEENSFEKQSIELNLRQRTYQDKNIISVVIRTSFYPKQINESIVEGSLEVVFDTDQVQSLNDLEDQTFTQNGSLLVSKNINGTFSHEHFYDVKLMLSKRDKNHINIFFESKKARIKVEETAVIVSLYSTSSSKKELASKFSLEGFYDTSIQKEIQKRTILKFFVKN